MDAERVEFDSLRPIAQQVVHDVITVAKANRPVDWNAPFPKMGQHYYWQELNGMPSYKSLCDKLFQIGNVPQKLLRHDVNQLVESFVEATLATMPGDTDPDATYWWEQLCNFLVSDELSTRTVFGLSNFRTEQQGFELDPNVHVLGFGASSLREEAPKLFRVWDWHGFTSDLSQAGAFHCKGAFLFDTEEPIREGQLLNIDNHDDAIHKMLRYASALRLAGFGRLLVDPWIIAVNPDFPVTHLTVVGRSDSLGLYSGPEYVLTKPVWERFVTANTLLEKLELAPSASGEPSFRATNRFRYAILQFDGTFSQGIWESAVVDLVIVLESLYLPAAQGGWLQVALAASNLLGTNEVETREVFENINQAYRIRNAYVHGEPFEPKRWNEFIYSTIRMAGAQIQADDRELGWYALELLRDYARRSILGLLNLHFEHKILLDGSLGGQLLRLHLDNKLRTELQLKALCYPLSERPPYQNPNLFGNA
jgi:hypothetical protein